MISVRVNEIFNYLSSDHKKVSPVTENACDIGFRMWFVKRIIDSQVMPALKSSLLFPEILFSRVFQIMKVRYPTKFAVFVAFVPAILRGRCCCVESLHWIVIAVDLLVHLLDTHCDYALAMHSTVLLVAAVELFFGCVYTSGTRHALSNIKHREADVQ